MAAKRGENLHRVWHIYGTVGSYYIDSTEDVVQEEYHANHLCVTERMGGGQEEGTLYVTRTS